MTRTKKILYLNVKGVYFDQMKAGYKKEEYRLLNAHWHNKLHGRHYDQIVIMRGYPKKDDEQKRLVLPYEGFEIKTITHEHFGADPVRVFAIRVNVPQKDQKQ